MSAHVEHTEEPDRRLRRRRWAMGGLAGMAAIVVIAGAVRAAESDHTAAPLTNSSSAFAPAAATSELPQLPSFAGLAQRVTSAVVSVYAQTEATGGSEVFGEPGSDDNKLRPNSPFEFFFRQFGLAGQNLRPHLVMAQGSGFFISSDGYILTNNHVVDHARSVQVKTVDGKAYPAKVVGTDATTDLAVLKVDGKASSFSHVTFAATPPRIGDWVLAVGNPFGLGSTVTAGIVSAEGRDIGSSPYNDFLQIDAPINRGNSGGPTFDLRGEVIGVNTAIYSPSGGSVGIAFDIPAETAKSVAAALESKGAVTRGWIGVNVQPVTQDIADSLSLKQASGALVANVQGGGPAAKAGMKTGDVILSMDGGAIADSRDLARKVAADNPGKTVTLEIWRDGKEQIIGLTIAVQPSTPFSQRAQAEQGRPKLGLALAPASQIAGAGSEGVVVVSVDPDGAAADKGIQPGDVILEIGGKSVSTPRELSGDIATEAKAGRHAVLLRVKSAAGTHFVAVRTGQG